MRISELPGAGDPDLDFLVPASKNDGTYGLTLRQIRALMQFASGEIRYADETVQDAIEGVVDGLSKVYSKGQIDDARWPVSKLEDAPEGRIIGRAASSGSGAPSYLDASAIETMLAPLRAGEIVMLPGGTIPAGRRLIKLNGPMLNREAYSHLWGYAQASGMLAASEGSKTPAQFGPGNGSTTFSAPDARGYFPRAWDDGRGIDAGRLLSAIQIAAIGGHSHQLPMGFDAGAEYVRAADGYNAAPIFGSVVTGSINRVSRPWTTDTSAGSARLALTSGVDNVISESRPINLATLFAIRF